MNCIQENGVVVKEMGKEYKNGIMETNMMVNGQMIYKVEKVLTNIKTGIFIKDNGKRISIMGKEN